MTQFNEDKDEEVEDKGDESSDAEKSEDLAKLENLSKRDMGLLLDFMEDYTY